MKTIFLFFFLSVNLMAEPLNVGVIVPLTGDFSRYGKKIVATIESNKEDSLNYIYEDEACDPKKAVSAYKKITSLNKAKIFLGPWCGTPQMAVAPLIKKNNQIAILGSSAPREVYKASGRRMFSTQHSIEEESIFNAKEIYKLGAKKVVIIFLDNSFSRAHEKAFREEYKGEVLKTLTYNTPDASALKSIAIKLKTLRPDTLYIPDAFPLIHGLLKTLKITGVKVKRILSVYSAQSKDVLDAIGKSGEGLLLSYPKIGNKNALNYFPKKAALIVKELTNACKPFSTECALSFLNKNYDFNKYGALNSKLGLKIVKDSEFIWVDN